MVTPEMRAAACAVLTERGQGNAITIADVNAMLGAAFALMPGTTSLHGPYGYLNGCRAMTEDMWDLEGDPIENNDEYFSIPLYAKIDVSFPVSVATPTEEEGEERCIACDVPFEIGDMVYWDASDTGHLHAECCGPERESYVNADGSPLADGDKIPEPFAWEPASAALNKDGMHSPHGFRWLDRPITVTGGDYQYQGQLLCSFPKESNGAVRYIVRDSNNRLFIHNAQQCGLEGA